MLIRTCIACGILVGLAGLGGAQQKPDFSGEWTLNRQASTLSPRAAAVHSGVVRIELRKVVRLTLVRMSNRQPAFDGDSDICRQL